MSVRKWFESTKIQNHPTWLRRMISDPFSVPPIYGDISAAGGCNHRCLHCAPSILEYKHNYLGLPIFTRFFSEAVELRKTDPDGLGIKSVQFAGEGEPALEKDLDKICAQARMSGIDVAMLSNGIAFTEDRAQAILPSVNIYLQFSVNAGTAETYTAFHQTNPRDWEKLWSNIERVVRLKQELKSNCEIGINMTVTIKGAFNKSRVWVPPNWPEAENLIKRASDAGVDYVCFKPYSQLPQNHETSELFGDMDYEPVLDEIIETGTKLREQYEREGFEVIFRFSRFKEYTTADRGYEVCHSTPTLWFYLQADGLLLSCQNHWLQSSQLASWQNSQFYLGNVRGQSIREIWYGERRRQHLQSMKTFDISVCRKGCHPDKENRYLYWLLGLSKQEQEAELTRLEKQISINGLPHRGNIL
ncbi:MAG: radical SAM protein [Candidatus Pacebacteria bacterium]|nr:radical SAM protein [Candidatus Paceibacterota bacterium]